MPCGPLLNLIAADPMTAEVSMPKETSETSAQTMLKAKMTGRLPVETCR
ncbi:hypothetical protein GCM10023193_22650 [Planotetraspora kaengkrachanensis]|uniref:Uncharacterized protein n=1 Tax=Planotetraspora kaengkrachanensis TaxID=575193 RepID=A0A8J3M0V5_9ACTN|nr:hypothetical protein Pka01_31500 [Planotetraspora kaengkrachanensis]